MKNVTLTSIALDAILHEDLLLWLQLQLPGNPRKINTSLSSDYVFEEAQATHKKLELLTRYAQTEQL